MTAFTEEELSLMRSFPGASREEVLEKLRKAQPGFQEEEWRELCLRVMDGVSGLSEEEFASLTRSEKARGAGKRAPNL